MLIVPAYHSQLPLELVTICISRGGGGNSVANRESLPNASGGLASPSLQPFPIPFPTRTLPHISRTLLHSLSINWNLSLNLFVYKQITPIAGVTFVLKVHLEKILDHYDDREKQ